MGVSMATTRWFLVLVICGCLSVAVELSEEDAERLESVERIGLEVPYMLENICCCSFVLENIDPDACERYLEGFPIESEWIAELWLSAENDTDVRVNYELASASFRYASNITDYNAQFKQNLSSFAQQMGLELRKQANRFVTDQFSYDIQRQFIYYSEVGFSMIQNYEKEVDGARNETAGRNDSEITTAMARFYSTGQVCLTSDTNPPPSLLKKYQDGDIPECMDLEPDLEGIIADSREEPELRYVWEQWRNAVGPPIGKLYPEYVKITNIAARNNGYWDRGEIWRENYEEDDFEQLVLDLWEEVRPMYLQIHAYVRRKLRDFYGPKIVSGRTIPAHLLGNMWSQQWQNIYDIVAPYPSVDVGDVTAEMVRQNYTVRRMFETAERFFMSIGLDPMPETFWENSMLEKPNDGRKVTCHGSASDLSAHDDVRIKMCTGVNMDDLHTVHHEMGHVEYYLMYRDQPIVFRQGANPGFHEAVGDTIGLSAVAPEYLHKIGLLDTPNTDKRADINYLMLNALEKISFLPFGLLIDQWRWKVFRGEITPENYNDEWWRLRRHYQGIHSPVDRPFDAFDPGVKYHIPGLTPYIRYFVSFLVQFQFHRSLCEEAGYEGPLHKCHIYESIEAGDKLRRMLSMGISRPWQDAMEELTGQRRIDPSAIEEYFEPLLEFIKADNEKNQEPLGWGETQSTSPGRPPKPDKKHKRPFVDQSLP